MRNRLAQCLLWICLACFSMPLIAKNTIQNYYRIFTPVYTKNNELLIAIRIFSFNGIPSFLTVNPETLETDVTPAPLLNARLKTIKKPGYATHWQIASTRYYQLLNKYAEPPYLLENQGVTHANRTTANVLTVDLCPSTKPFEAAFFKKLSEISEKTHTPTPVAISISGLWLIENPETFQWLIQQVRDKKLDITWVNHSLTHAYYTDLPDAHNFLLRPEINMDAEILATEQYLLEQGQMPSVFFRFPGLISSPALLHTLKQYGLIPLGADAWLAALDEKHEKLTPGGIILVHGNGNEPKGIKILLQQIDTLQWASLPLSL